MSSANPGLNPYDEILSYLAHETDKEIYFDQNRPGYTNYGQSQ